MSIHYHQNTAGFRLTYFSQEYAERTAITAYDGYRRRRYTYGELLRLSFQTAGFLLAEGFRKGDAVMLLSQNRTEYAVVVFAGAILGIKVVPVDVTLPMVAVRCSIDAVAPRLIITSREEVLASAEEAICGRVLSVDSLFESIASFPTSAKALFDAFPEVEWYVDESDIYFVIFTSGTLSEPKLVPLTHRNLISNIANLRQMCSVPEDYAVLSMAPLSHALGLTLGLFAILAYGAHLVMTENLDSITLRRILQQDRIDGIVTVPAFLSLLKEKIETGLAAHGRREAFERALPKMLGLPIWMRRRMFRKLLAELGKDLKWIVTGASALSTEVGNFFEAVGIKVTQGYGLTECLMVCVSDFEWRKMGTVGRCLPNQEIRLDENNEIWVAGPNVFSGYAGLDQANREIFKDGWMRTGDIGKLDEEGRLTIVGRAKNVIIGPTGLNIYPEDIEAEVEKAEMVRACIVVNAPKKTGDIYLVAVVLLKEHAEEAALESLRINLNCQLGSHQRLAGMLVWPEADFPRTSSKKVKRKEVEAALAEMCKEARRAGDTESLAATCTEGIGAVVVELLSSLCHVEMHAIKGSDRLVEDLGLDSLGLMELMCEMEARLLKPVPRDAFFHRDMSVDEVIEMIEKGTEEVYRSVEPFTPSVMIRGLLAVSRGVSRWTLPALFRSQFNVEVQGSELLGKISKAMRTEGHLIAANHASHLDGMSLFTALPRSARKRLVAAAAQDYFFNPEKKLRHYLLAGHMRAFPLDRASDPRAYFTTIARLLDQGDSVLIFPEGTRSRTGALGPFHPSVGRLIQEMGAPVLPVFLKGTHALWPVHERRPKRGKITVRFHEPISFSKMLSPYEIRDRLADLFAANLG